jgi:hypothetical protein
MSEHFTLYSNAIAAMEQAEKRASELVGGVQARLTPLFNDWKHCYLSDVVESVPAILERNGPDGVRRNIRTVDLPDIYNQIMIAMQTFAENQQEAMNHWGQVPQAEKNRATPPPWMKTMADRVRRT